MKFPPDPFVVKGPGKPTTIVGQRPFDSPTPGIEERSTVDLQRESKTDTPEKGPLSSVGSWNEECRSFLRYNVSVVYINTCTLVYIG